MTAHAKGLELVGGVQTGVPAHVIGDSTRIRQVLANLLGNAIKFTAKGEVTLEVTHVGQGDDRLSLHFVVRDTGIGIAADKQAMIFEAFAQADGSTTRKFGGTGLGLAISERLAKAMGGGILVESEPGTGSRFDFTASVGFVPEPFKAFASTGGVSLRDVPVMVVDDNPTNLRILGEILRSWGMAPEMAADGGQALALIRSRKDRGDSFQIVLADLHMPDMDGVALAGQLRAERPAIKPATQPVVLMVPTGEQAVDRLRARDLGIVGYLTKPVRRSELQGAISTALSDITGERARSRALSSPKLFRAEIPPVGRSLHILLAEDNKVNQMVACGILELAGHTVEVAQDGTEVSPMLAAKHFDVVLMDVQMPQMDGFQATAAIREGEKRTGAHIPVLALTAQAMTGDRERCLAAGMDGYLTKPLNHVLLLEALAEYQETPEECGSKILAERTP